MIKQAQHRAERHTHMVKNQNFKKILLDLALMIISKKGSWVKICDM